MVQPSQAFQTQEVSGGPVDGTTSATGCFLRCGTRRLATVRETHPPHPLRRQRHRLHPPPRHSVRGESLSEICPKPSRWRCCPPGSSMAGWVAQGISEWRTTPEAKGACATPPLKHQLPVCAIFMMGIFGVFSPHFWDSFPLQKCPKKRGENTSMAFSKAWSTFFRF